MKTKFLSDFTFALEADQELVFTKYKLVYKSAYASSSDEYYAIAYDTQRYHNWFVHFKWSTQTVVV